MAIDAFKRLVGIVDNADRLRQEVDRILSRTVEKAQRLADQSESFHRELQSSDQRDPQQVIRLIETIGNRAPILFRDARELLPEFRNADRQIVRLQRTVQREFPRSQEREALGILQSARKELDKAQRLNTRAIREYDTVVRTYNSELRSYRAKLVGLAAADFVLTGGVARTIAATIRGVHQGRVTLNAMVGIMSPLLLMLEGVRRLTGFLGQQAASAIRGGHSIALRIAKTLGLR